MKNKIPKIIHYCWFGNNPKPRLVKKCIKSWKKYLPDYEIREWNDSHLNLIDLKYVKEAYEAKKYAFVSDVFRLYALKIMEEYISIQMWKYSNLLMNS